MIKVITTIIYNPVKSCQILNFESWEKCYELFQTGKVVNKQYDPAPPKYINGDKK